jgi:hypothetical protein
MNLLTPESLVTFECSLVLFSDMQPDGYKALELGNQAGPINRNWCGISVGRRDRRA